MSSGTAVLPRPSVGSRVRSVPATAVRATRWAHLPGLGAQLLVAAWLCRDFLTSAIPAGTDTLGFISRAATNAHGGTWLSAWSPDSLGAPRQITLESLLGVLTKLTGSPFVTVKLFMLLTLLVSGAAAYWLTWRWYRTRLGAAVAGLLFMTSQISLAQTASGHLNVCVVLALAPFVIGLTADGVERFSVRRACLLGVTLALLILSRPDMVLYLAPLAALYVPVRGLVDRRLREAISNGLLTAGVALVVAIGLSMYEIVPFLGGVHAAWVSGGGLFQLQEFNARSLPALASLVGFGREIGYLAFTGRQTWFSHPWVSYGVYIALAAIPVAAAWGTLALRRDSRTLYLLVCAVVGAFAAKGLYGPLGGPYHWAVLHVPFFGNLRDPNRWLIGSWLAVAMLAGVASARLPQLWRWLEATRSARVLTAAALVCLAALPNAPTLIPGLATWRPTAGQLALLRAASTGAAPIATVPFDQTRRYLTDGNYQGWEHDLGSESALWTGRPALQDGGWSHPAAATIAYLTTLLGRRDPTFVPLLGTLGVSNVLSFNYSPTAPHLVNNSDPLYQQQALGTMHGLTVVQRDGDGSLSAIAGAAPTLSAPTLRAVVLGGRSGLRALIRLHGVVSSRWAAEDAGGLIAAGGEEALLAAIHSANLVLVADASVNDLSVLATPPLVRLPGISSDPQQARATQTLPPDVATRTGALLDENAPTPTAGQRSASIAFTLPRTVTQAELWAHVRTLHDAAQLSFSIDAHAAGAITPLAPADAGYSWVRIATTGLAAGSHTLTAVANPSPYGSSFDLDAVRLERAGARERVLGDLTTALAAASARTAYAADLGDALRTVDDPNFFAPVSTLGGGAGYWRKLDPVRSVLSATGDAVTLSFRADRQYHALLAHYFAAPRDWSHHAYAFLSVRGTGSGAAYRVLIDADIHHRYTIQLPWIDTTSAWRQLAIPLLGNPTVARHVISVRVAADDTSGAGALQVGTLALSAARTGVAVNLPIPAVAAHRARFVDLRGAKARSLVATPLAGGVAVHISLAKLGEHGLLLVAPPAGVPMSAPAVVRFSTDGGNRFSFRVSSERPFTLVLARSQDPGWRLAGVTDATPTRAWGALQAWRLPAGHYAGTISFVGDGLLHLGAAVSAAFALAVIALILLLRRRRGPLRVLSTARTPPLPARRTLILVAWIAPWIVALALLLLSPLTAIHGPSGLGDDMAVAALVAMAEAIVLAAISTRRLCAPDDS